MNKTSRGSLMTLRVLQAITGFVELVMEGASHTDKRKRSGRAVSLTKLHQ